MAGTIAGRGRRVSGRSVSTLDRGRAPGSPARPAVIAFGSTDGDGAVCRGI